VNPDPIPATMKGLAQWVYWRSEPTKNGTSTKRPYRVGKAGEANLCGHASSTDSGTWATFADVHAGLVTANGSLPYDGIGFAVQGSGIVFIDFDHVRNRATGEIVSWASEIVNALGSYVEVSPSGEGLHVYALGKLPGKGVQRKFADGSALEMYDAGRYATVTGHPLAGTPVDIHPSDVEALYKRLKNGALGPDTGELTEEIGTPEGNEAPEENKAGVLRLLEKFGLTIASTENPFQGQTETGVKYVLDACPFNLDHKDAAVFDYPSGPVFSCFHDSCAGNDWHALCRKFGYQALILGESGKPKVLLSNALVMLRQTPEWDGCVAYNEFNLTVVIKRLPPWSNSGPVGRAWNDNDDRLTACWLQRHDVLVNSRIAAEAAQAIAQENPFHPVKNYLKTLTWDQTERIDTWLCTYLGVEDSPYTRAIASRWLISGVARIYQPGCQADAVLLLEGPQGILKSSALRTLAGDEWFSDCVSELGSKDSRLELYGNWIIEIPECDRIKRGDLERVKAFLSTRSDKFRPPYGRHSATFPRSCIFAGSSNDETPFTDPTGNRRFWPVRCVRIELDRLRKDRDQIWAEALVRYRAGAPWWLETRELNEAATQAQNQRYLPGIWDEQILNWCDDPQPRAKRDEDHGPSGDVSWELPFDSTHDAVTVYDVLTHGLGKTLDKFGSGDVMQVVNCLRHNGWTRVPQCRVKGSEGRVRLFLRPGVTL
jgi:hypothetical protein